MRINLREGPASASSEEDSVMKLEELRAVKVVGKGAMGTVFLVEKPGCDRPLAFKAMSKSVMEKQIGGLKGARTEKEILRSLRHPFLPNLVGHVETDKIVGWVVDYCPGGDLNVLRHKQSDKMFPECIIRFYAAEIVLALEHLHRLGVVYRDLKPENVLLQADGHIMLTDFDLSTRLPVPPRTVQSSKAAADNGPPPRPKRRSGAFALMTSWMTSLQSVRVSPVNRNGGGTPSLTRSNSFVGTEEYVSPEMLKADGHDFSVDWWAMGVLLYELLCGKTPFKGSNRKETFYRILVMQPQFMGPWTPLHDLIQRLLTKDPHNRLGSHHGADEIKSHVFFRGLDWESMETVSRAPFVPPPMCLEDLSSMQSIDVEKYLHDKQIHSKDVKKQTGGGGCKTGMRKLETEDFTMF